MVLNLKRKAGFILYFKGAVSKKRGHIFNLMSLCCRKEGINLNLKRVCPG